VAAEFSALIGEVIQDKVIKAKGATGLTKPEKMTLLQNLLWKYLDLVSFSGESTDKLQAIAGILDKMRKNGISMDKMFEAWDPDQVRKYEPGIDLGKIKNSLTGS
jgi:hypothetical protein